MVIEKIAIDFGDNDFTTIYRVFGEAIQDILTDPTYRKEITKDSIIELWNQSCYGLYVLFQNRLEYGNVIERTHTGKYLQLDLQDIHRVYFNEEVDEYLNEIKMDGNMEVLYIDGYSIQII